jgi:hypothetical protein
MLASTNCDSSNFAKVFGIEPENSFEYRFTIKLGTMMIVAVGATATILKLLHTV